MCLLEIAKCYILHSFLAKLWCAGAPIIKTMVPVFSSVGGGWARGASGVPTGAFCFFFFLTLVAFFATLGVAGLLRIVIGCTERVG